MVGDAISVRDWTSRLRLKRSGSEWVGPCPSCGGRDRFHVRPGFQARALVGCRGCIDGRGSGARREAYWRIRDLVFGDMGWTQDTSPLPPRVKPNPYRQEPFLAAMRNAKRMIARASYEPHPYLKAKGFGTARGLVLEDQLLVSVYDPDIEEVVTVQRIFPDGRKLFLKGSKVSGCYHQIGREPERWLCEGYATGLSVAEALRSIYVRARVVVTFSAVNLRKCARPGDRVVADHDPTGTGTKVAEETGCDYWAPPELGDANDYHQRYGVVELAEALREIL